MSNVQRRGSVLLLSLLILSAVLATATAVATLVARGLRAERSVPEAVAAYYAAESGLERGLFAVAQNPAITPDALAITAVFPNAATLFLKAENAAERVRVPFVPDGGTVVVEAYDPAHGASGTLAAGIDTLTIENGGTLSLLYCKERADASALADCAGIVVGTDVIRELDPAKAYRFMWQAVGADARDVAFSAARGGVSVSLPIPFTIAATGTFASSRQAMQVIVPQRSPL